MLTKQSQQLIRSEIARLRGEIEALEAVLRSTGADPARRGPGRPPKSGAVSRPQGKRGTKAGSAGAKRIGEGMAKRWALARRLHKEGKIKAPNLQALKAYEAK